MNITIVKDINICGMLIEKGSKITVHKDILSVETIRDNEPYRYPIIPEGIGKTLSELVKEINNLNNL